MSSSVRALSRMAIVVVAAAVVGTAASAHPAQAQEREKCEQDGPRTIKIPKQADVKVTHRTCIVAFPQGDDVFKFKAYVHTAWEPTGNGEVGTRFRDFDVQARLEFNPANPDTDLEVKNCEILPQINGAASGEATCETPVSQAFVEVDPAFSGDGTVVYDIDGDDERRLTRELHGTGLL